MENAANLVSSALARRGYKQTCCPKARVLQFVADDGTVELPAGVIHFVPRGLLDRLYKPEVYFDAPNSKFYVERPFSSLSAISGFCVPFPHWDKMPATEFLQGINGLCGRAEMRPGARAQAPSARLHL